MQGVVREWGGLPPAGNSLGINSGVTNIKPMGMWPPPTGEWVTLWPGKLGGSLGLLCGPETGRMTHPSPPQRCCSWGRCCRCVWGGQGWFCHQRAGLQAETVGAVGGAVCLSAPSLLPLALQDSTSISNTSDPNTVSPPSYPLSSDQTLQPRIRLVLDLCRPETFFFSEVSFPHILHYI